MLLKSLLITAVTGRAAEILAARSACLFWVQKRKTAIGTHATCGFAPRSEVAALTATRPSRLPVPLRTAQADKTRLEGQYRAGIDPRPDQQPDGRDIGAQSLTFRRPVRKQAANRQEFR
jgi:hypothetical protein